MKRQKKPRSRPSSQILNKIYHRLISHYGPQHWWPGETPFEVIIGAILTQSAAWTNVEKAVTNLKTADALSPSKIRDLPLGEMARLIHPCGYYNAKAAKLNAFVSWLGEYYHDNLNSLFALEPEALRRQLLSLNGIGEETADSIMLYAGEKPIFVIDAYTKRIISRVGLLPDTAVYKVFQEFFMNNLPPDTHLFNEFHALLVTLGKNACQKKPLCSECCLADICQKRLLETHPQNLD